MSQTKVCRLCVKVCRDYVSLYNENGEPNNICKRVLKYFDSMFLTTDQVAGSAVLCLECCGHISVFYNFQQTVFQAQRRLREGEREIEYEFKIKSSEELIWNNNDNLQVTVKQDDSISLPDLELAEEFMFEDNLQKSDNQVNSQTVIEPMVLWERVEAEEDNKHSNDQPLSISDSPESVNYTRKQNGDVPIPLCEDTKEFGDNIIINNFHTEQSEDQPLPTSDKSESEKGSDSDDSQPLMAIKRKLRRSQRLGPKDRDTVSAQRKASLECVVCKKSLANFNSLSEHFRLDHPNMYANKPLTLCAKANEFGNTNDKIIINNIKNEQTEDQPISASGPFESKKGNDSDFIQSTPNPKLPQLPTRDDSDAVIAQWKPRLECVVCKKSMTNFLSLRLHFRLEHPKERCRVECCGRELDSRWMVAKHARLHLNQDKLTQIPISEDFDAIIAQWKPSLKCVVCKKSVANFLSLRFHFRREHPKERCRVECCSRQFYNRQIMAWHARLHLNPRKVKCLQCDSYFASKTRMNVHLSTCKSSSEHFPLEDPNMHANEPLPLCTNAKEFGNKNDKVIITNKDNEQNEDQPLAASDQCEAEKSSESDFIQPTTTMKHNLTQNPIQEDYDVVIAQWKPTLECVVCKESVANFPLLSLHFRREHPRERCRVECCSRKFYMRCRLANHVRDHLNPYNLKETRRLALDAVIARWRPSLECLVCQKSVTNFESLSLHFSLDHPNERCRVECCSRQFYERWRVAQHARVHLNPDKRSVPYDFDAVIAQWRSSLECVVCKKSVTNFLSLRLHFSREHPKQRCYVECCSRQFYKRATVVNHAHLHLNPDKVKCLKCDSYFATKKAMEIHLHTCKNGNSKLGTKSRTECVICKTSFSEFSLMRVHYRLKHPTEVCYALCCERKFYQNNAFEDHMRLHRDPNAFQCKKCGKRLTTPYVLKKHMRCFH